MNKTLIHWDDAIYSVGLSKMDSQHRQLVGLINGLAAQHDSKDHDFIDRVFATLVTYTKQHFVDEERMLRKINYPHLESHHEAHLRFIHTLNNLKADYDRQGGTPEMLDNLTLFLKKWLTHHILVEDKAYATYLET